MELLQYNLLLIIAIIIAILPLTIELIFLNKGKK